MAGYTGNQDDFDRAYSSLDDVKNEMDTNLKTLGNEMQDVLTVWKGNAADAFRNLMEQVDTKGGELNTALANLTELMKTAGASYAKMEDEGGSSFAGGGFEAL